MDKKELKEWGKNAYDYYMQHIEKDMVIDSVNDILHQKQ